MARPPAAPCWRERDGGIGNDADAFAIVREMFATVLPGYLQTTIALGLMVAVVAVYGLVSLRSDVDRYTEAEKDTVIARAAQKAAESPVVLQAVTAPIGLGAPGSGAQTEVAGATIGWRVNF